MLVRLWKRGSPAATYRTHGRRRACETPQQREARLHQTSDDRRNLRKARFEHEIFD